ncbi:S-adenosylmethionine:tRNA-ribosyltransferase-isomerase [Candidatus Moduliflexus flocculans]|uniref:S-adenosylmethionine:tRNA-ribosyltransferase-isomerase n=1 Tax=Candidatus Moduliflexus flocculans TaxID=1499966 RepID=A0A0S6W566_9BACT|nr:S-adenosylmethionine:tRNA-ribosyltransferase-isomerase [Candidatus Moduliflexus flocculans]
MVKNSFGNMPQMERQAEAWRSIYRMIFFISMKTSELWPRQYDLFISNWYETSLSTNFQVTIYLVSAVGDLEKCRNRYAVGVAEQHDFYNTESPTG